MNKKYTAQEMREMEAIVASGDIGQMTRETVAKMLRQAAEMRDRCEEKRKELGKMIVVNLFGGPGCGKSTGAAHIFSRLKQSGVSCELVTEVAKGYVWDDALNLLHDQTLVLAQQYHNLRRLEGLVDVAITDSPIILSNIYLKNDPKWGVGTHPFELFSYALHNQFDNRNYFLRRFNPYECVGRCELEEDARKLDGEIKKLVGNTFDSYKEVDGNSMGYEQIVSDVLDILRKQRST